MKVFGNRVFQLSASSAKKFLLFADSPTPDIQKISWITLVKAREHASQLLIAKMIGHSFTQHLAEIRGDGQIAPFIKLSLLQAGPAAVNLAAFHRPAQDKHYVGVAMVGAAIAVLPRRAPEL